jgi:hypothetical protein
LPHPNNSLGASSFRGVQEPGIRSQQRHRLEAGFQPVSGLNDDEDEEDWDVALDTSEPLLLLNSCNS